MRILVTGGAGFIGAHVARRLIDEGEKVEILDNLNEYYDPELKHARLREIVRLSEDRIHRIDIADEKSLHDIFRNGRFEAVVHLAAQAGVRYSLTNPEAYEESNLKGFLNILECCRRAGVSKLIYASSSSVYGANEKIPFSESDPVDRPLSLYAATKRANELMAYAYHRLYGIQTVGLRFFTVYGPYGRPDMALFLFTEAILRGRAIDVYNHGDMRRDFTYIDDIVAGTVSALRTDAACEVFNLGRGESQKLTDFIGALEKHLGRRAEKNLLPMQPGDVPATWADISKAQARLAYRPSVSIEEGVGKFVAWHKTFYPDLHR